MDIAKTALWKWVLLLIAGLFLSMLAYGIASSLGMFGGHVLLNVLWAALILGGYALLVHWIEKRPVSELSLRRLLPETGKGLLIGVLYFGAIVAVMAVLGYYRITGAQLDWLTQARALTFFLIVAVGEEVIFRGILFRMIDTRWNTTAALIVSATVFGLVHIMNDNATWWSALAIAIEAGLMLGAAYKWSGTLWAPIGIHWAWNYTQGNILGFAVSGNDAGASVFTAEISGPEILTGGPFGAEASVIAVVIGAAVAAWMLWSAGKARRG